MLCARVHRTSASLFLAGSRKDDSTSPAYFRVGASALAAAAEYMRTTLKQSPMSSAAPVMLAYATAIPKYSEAWDVCGKCLGTASCKVFHGMPSAPIMMREHAALARPLIGEGKQEPSM